MRHAILAGLLASASIFSLAGAQVPISGLPAATTPLSGSEAVPLVQSGVTKQATTNSIAALAVSSQVLAINVTTYGATGNNTASADQLGFQNAITAACATATATGGVVEVDVPVPPISYLISTALPVCTNLHIHGIGGRPTIVFTGTGLTGAHTGLFTNGGQDNVEIDHLELDGQSHAYAYAYVALSNASSALQFSMHDTFFNNWGTGTSGGWVSIESDSGGNTFWHNYGVANTANFSITAPTDGLHIYDNLLTATNGTCFVIASAVPGAATAKIDHNLLECELGGAANINTLGQWIIEDNEEETLNALTNANSAVWDIENWTLGQFDRNVSNSHAGANYDFYINNAITDSEFGNNVGVSAVLSSFKVGTGLGEIYLFNNSGNGPSHVYDVDFPGIITNQTFGGRGFAFGCGVFNTTNNGFTNCGRITQFSTGTGTSSNAQFLSPNLASGNVAGVDVGQSFATGNAVEIGLHYVSNNSSSNFAYISLNGFNPLEFFNTGNLQTQGAFTAVGGLSTSGTVTGNAFTASAIPGVSCAANTVSLTTLVVTDGIVTHC